MFELCFIKLALCLVVKNPSEFFKVVSNLFLRGISFACFIVIFSSDFVSSLATCILSFNILS